MHCTKCSTEEVKSTHFIGAKQKNIVCNNLVYIVYPYVLVHFSQLHEHENKFCEIEKKLQQKVNREKYKSKSLKHR